MKIRSFDNTPLYSVAIFTYLPHEVALGFSHNDSDRYFNLFVREHFDKINGNIFHNALAEEVWK